MVKRQERKRQALLSMAGQAMTYDVCYGSMIRNQKDFLTFPSSCMLLGVTIFVVPVLQDSIVLLTTYQMEAKRLKMETGVLQFVHGFDELVCLVV